MWTVRISPNCSGGLHSRFTTRRKCFPSYRRRILSLSLSLFLAANPASVSYIRVKHTFMGFYTAKYEGRPRWGRVAPRTGMSHVRSGECFVMPAMSEPTLLAKRSIFQGIITIGKWWLCIGCLLGYLPMEGDRFSSQVHVSHELECSSLQQLHLAPMYTAGLTDLLAWPTLRSAK